MILQIFSLVTFWIAALFFAWLVIHPIGKVLATITFPIAKIMFQDMEIVPGPRNKAKIGKGTLIIVVCVALLLCALTASYFASAQGMTNNSELFFKMGDLLDAGFNFVLCGWMFLTAAWIMAFRDGFLESHDKLWKKFVEEKMARAIKKLDERGNRNSK